LPITSFCERPQLDVERPRAAILMNDVPNLVCDRLGFNEKFVWPIGVALPRPLQINHRVDDDIGDVHAFWTQLARQRLGKDPLCRLGRRKGGAVRLTPPRRRIAGGNDRAFAGADHRRGKSPRQIQQTHRVDLEVAVQNCRIDLEECTDCSANSVVDDDVRTTEIILDGGRRRFDLRGIRNVALITLCVPQFLLECGKTALASCEQG
jgi:hypothetical protein